MQSNGDFHRGRSQNKVWTKLQLWLLERCWTWSVFNISTVELCPHTQWQQAVFLARTYLSKCSQCCEVFCCQGSARKWLFKEFIIIYFALTVYFGKNLQTFWVTLALKKAALHKRITAQDSFTWDISDTNSERFWAMKPLKADAILQH